MKIKNLLLLFMLLFITTMSYSQGSEILKRKTIYTNTINVLDSASIKFNSPMTIDTINVDRVSTNKIVMSQDSVTAFKRISTTNTISSDVISNGSTSYLTIPYLSGFLDSLVEAIDSIKTQYLQLNGGTMSGSLIINSLNTTPFSVVTDIGQLNISSENYGSDISLCNDNNDVIAGTAADYSEFYFSNGQLIYNVASNLWSFAGDVEIQDTLRFSTNQGFKFGSIFINALTTTIINDNNTLATSGAIFNYAAPKEYLWNDATLQDNIFIGLAGTASAKTGGFYNIFMGSLAGGSSTDPYDNIFIGNGAGYNSTDPQYNVFIGSSAGVGNTTGDANTFIGQNSGYSNQTGGSNACLGVNAGYGVRGNYNIAIGYNAGGTVNNNDNNLYIGKNAGKYNTLANRMFIGMFDETNLAGDSTGSLVYGVFNDNTAQQKFVVNGDLEVSEYIINDVPHSYMSFKDSSVLLELTLNISIQVTNPSDSVYIKSGIFGEFDMFTYSGDTIIFPSDIGGHYAVNGHLSFLGGATSANYRLDINYNGSVVASYYGNTTNSTAYETIPICDIYVGSLTGSEKLYVTLTNLTNSNDITLLGGGIRITPIHLSRL